MATMLKNLNEQVTTVLAEHGCPSLSIAVAEQGEVVLAEAFGRADTATGRPATPGTAYGVASITKPMTATAVCLAADEGVLDLDAPVPGIDGPRVPTARQLLQHRGGFGAYYDWDYGDRPEPSTGPGSPRQAPMADRYTVVRHEPGSAFEYANLGYRVLGRLLEQATGRPLADFVRERVFTPLGLAGLHIGRRYPGPGPAAVRYTVDGRAYPDYGSSHPGATLGWATAGELALFAQSFDRLLKPPTVAAVRAALPVHPSLGYGLGWCVSSGDGPVLLSHGGGAGGVAAMVVAVPERRLSVAVLTNTTDKAARDAVLGRVLPALIPGHRAESINPAVHDPSRPLELSGHWTGHIAAPERDVPVELRVLPGDRAELRVDGAAATGPAGASRAWDLRVDLPLQLPTADARISSPRLALALRRAGAALTGTAYAYKDGDATGLLGNLLTHPCRLTPRPRA
jgi:CubicO group peptidase (beta-lactamase class C family)